MKCESCNKDEMVGSLYGIRVCADCYAKNSKLEFNHEKMTIETVYTKPVIHLK